MQRFVFLTVFAALCMGSVGIHAQSNTDQGKALLKAGKFAEAIPFFEQAVNLREEKFAPDHPKTAKAIESLAKAHRAAGNYAKAESLYKRALTIWETAKGPGHPRTLKAPRLRACRLTSGCS